MYSKEVLENNEQMEKERKEEALKMTGGREVSLKTRSGFEIKPVYTPADLADMNYEDIAVPGKYPYTRGYYPLHYQVTPVAMSQGMGIGDAEETKKRREFLKKIGRGSYVGREDDTFNVVLTLDLPTQAGFDPDDPEARGKVAECGVSISHINDMIALFKDTPPLNQVVAAFIAFNAAEVDTALYAVYASDIRKEPWDGLVIWPVSEHNHQYFYDMVAYPPKTGLKLKAELIKWLRNNCPNSLTYIFDGYNVAEAGAPPALEAALAISEAIATVDECVKIGLDPNDFLPTFCAHLELGLHVFEDVAKVRAVRRLWSKIAKERYKSISPEACKLKMLLNQCAGFDTGSLEPLNNLIRITIMAIGGLLADLDGMWIISYDEALGIPSDEAIKLSTRTYQILVEETDLAYVTDPLGGSYYIESLTNKMEEEISKILNQIQDMGGFIEALQSGWIRSEVARKAYERMRRTDKGEEIRVGVNKYRVEEKLPKMNVVRRPDELEENIIANLRKFKEDRDNEKTKIGLNKLKEAALAMENDWPNSAGTLMPALIDAIRANATGGECCRVFREVFGFGYYAG